MTHFGLGSSGKEPWGSLLGVRCGVTFLGTSTVCLGDSAVPLGSLDGPLPTECLGFCLPDLRGGCCLLGKDFPQQRNLWWPCFLLGRKHCHQEWGELPEALNCFLPLGEAECLPGKLIKCFLPFREGEYLPACQPEMLLNCFLPFRGKVSTCQGSC